MRSLARRLGLSAIAYYNQKLLFVATSTSMSDRPSDVPVPDRRSLSATLAVSAKQRVFEKERDRVFRFSRMRSQSFLFNCDRKIEGCDPCGNSEADRAFHHINSVSPLATEIQFPDTNSHQ